MIKIPFAVDVELLVKELIRDEGRSKALYRDHLGYWTIGVGRLVDKDLDHSLTQKDAFLSKEEIEYLLQNDLYSCISDIQGEVWFRSCDTDARRRALVNMRFQLGSKGLRSFKESLNLISQKQWKKAGVQLRKSLWYKQTPERAERVIKMIENGN